jgi:crossover junction endodeoxyribonuclease RuvC
VNRPLRAIGLDLSLAGTGIAVSHDQLGEPRLSCRTITPRRRKPATLMDHERIHETVAAVQAAAQCRPDVVVIESPLLLEGHGDTSVRLGELHGPVKHWLWAKGIPYADVHNTHLKQYACGKGNAKKEEVKEAVIARYGRLLHVHTYDEADAVSLLAMTLDAYGQPLGDVPATHRRAVAATTWPELGGGAR